MVDERIAQLFSSFKKRANQEEKNRQNEMIKLIISRDIIVKPLQEINKLDLVG